MNRTIGLLLKSFFQAFALAAALCSSPVEIRAQQVVDKTVATVSDGVRLVPELITYSDLLWRIALQPDAPLSPPNSEDLNSALRALIDERLIGLEAERLPSAAATKEEIDREIARIVVKFPYPQTENFEKRLRAVGFDSVDDANFQKMMRQRVAIEKYLDFRFGSFVVITPDEENRYYQDVFTPDFRRRNPGLLMPSLDEKRAEINRILTEGKIEEDIERFLDEARRRAEIVVLFEV